MKSTALISVGNYLLAFEGKDQSAMVDQKKVAAIAAALELEVKAVYTIFKELTRKRVLQTSAKNIPIEHRHWKIDFEQLRQVLSQKT